MFLKYARLITMDRTGLSFEDKIIHDKDLVNQWRQQAFEYGLCLISCDDGNLLVDVNQHQSHCEADVLKLN